MNEKELLTLFMEWYRDQHFNVDGYSPDQLAQRFINEKTR